MNVMALPILPLTEERIVAMNVMTLPIPPPTGETIVATMGLIQEYTHPSYNIDPFTYEHILIDNVGLSDCHWMFDKSKNFENSVNNIIVFHIRIKR